MHIPMIGSITSMDLMVVGYLIILEGLLSFDNALALAALVRKRLSNDSQRKKALLWGIWGAYLFRIVIILIGVRLMKFKVVSFIAGAYLVYLAIKELVPHKVVVRAPNIFKHAKMSHFWATVISVELLDIMFSVDSIGAAFAVSNKVWVLMAGAVLGILLMRLAAGLFIQLMNKLPILEPTAFVLVGIAGISILLKTFGIKVPEIILLTVLLSTLILAIILNLLFPSKFQEFCPPPEIKDE